MSLRVIVGETQFAALIARQPIIVQVPDGENLELVLASISPDRLLEIHLEAAQVPPDAPQTPAILPARRRNKKG